jgi:hypothetical protein
VTDIIHGTVDMHRNEVDGAVDAKRKEFNQPLLEVRLESSAMIYKDIPECH